MAGRKKVKLPGEYSQNKSTKKNNKLRESKSGEEFKQLKDKNASLKVSCLQTEPNTCTNTLQFYSTYWKKHFQPKIQHMLSAESDINKRQQLEKELKLQSKNVAVEKR